MGYRCPPLRQLGAQYLIKGCEERSDRLDNQAVDRQSIHNTQNRGSIEIGDGG